MDSSLCKAPESLRILGLTVPETSDAIKKAYARILHEPIIDVDLKDFQKAYFIVTGQVSSLDSTDLRYDLTASEAIAVAGGFMADSKDPRLSLPSLDGWLVQARELKLKDFLHGKNVNEDAQIRSGEHDFRSRKTITKVRKYIPYGVGVPVGISPLNY